MSDVAPSRTVEIEILTIEDSKHVPDLELIVLDNDGAVVFTGTTNSSGRLIVSLPGNTVEYAVALHRKPTLHIGTVREGATTARIECSVEKLADAHRDINIDRRIALVHLLNGSHTDLPPKGLTIVVGPNGCGKTRLLHELHKHITWGKTDFKIVSSVTMTNGKPAPWKIAAWLRSNFDVRTNTGIAQADWIGLRIPIHISRYDESLGAFFSYFLDIETRLDLTRPQSLGAIADVPKSLVDIAFRNDPLRIKLTSEIKNRFGKTLVPLIDPNVSFRLAGENDIIPHDTELGLGAGRAAAAALPPLFEAGHGIRSYFGTLLAAEASPHPVLLLDEPEAFLHPPQARALARRLSMHSSHRQVVVATHSADFVAAAISTSCCDVKIIRLSRRSDTTTAVSLDPEQLRSLVAGPQMESTELLGCIFHDAAILCEADADRRFYRFLSNQDHGDIEFLACNGKGGISRSAKALRNLGVPCAAIVDFDVIRDERTLRSILESLSDESFWTAENTHDYKVVRNRFHQKPILTRQELLDQCSDLAGKLQDDSVEVSAVVRSLGDIVERSKSGYEAKRYGLAAYKGAERQAADRLVNALAVHGLYVVPVGELEGWWEHGAADKAAWIAQVWENRFSTDLARARDWIAVVRSRFSVHAEPGPGASP